MELREFVEPLWREWKDSYKPGWRDNEPTLSYGMCRFTCAFAAPILNDELGLRLKPAAGFSNFHPVDRGWNGKGQPATSIGGTDGLGGILGSDGVWHEHYWLTDNDIIVDFTADQFGLEPVIVTDAADPRFLANWKAREVAIHMRDVAGRAKEWRESWTGSREPVGPRI